MSWQAHTNFAAIMVSARLCIFRNGQIQGLPEPMLVGDHDILIRQGDMTAIDAKVEDATLRAATLVMPNGVRFQMTPRRPDEPGADVRVGLRYSRDWIIRSQIVP